MKRTTAILGALCLGGLIAATSVTHASAFDPAPRAARPVDGDAVVSEPQVLYIGGPNFIMPVSTDKVCFYAAGGRAGGTVGVTESALDLARR
jgi:hypothetical protein